MSGRPVGRPVCLFVCRAVILSVCLSDCLSVCLCACLSVGLLSVSGLREGAHCQLHESSQKLSTVARRMFISFPASGFFGGDGLRLGAGFHLEVPG